jgi:hypothetical protein
VPVRAQALAVGEPASEQVLALVAWEAVQVQASAVVQPELVLEPEWAELEVQVSARESVAAQWEPARA